MNNLIKQSTLINLVFSLLFISLILPINAQTEDKQQERVYIKIEIKGLACPYCAFGMEKELKKVAGVDNVEIELEEGLAYISTPISQKPLKEALTFIITNAGFTVGNIEYRDKPFVDKKSKK